MIVPASGGAERTVTRLSTGADAWQPDASIMRSPGPAWSPGGSLIAVADRVEGHAGDRQVPARIYLVSVPSGERRAVTSPGLHTLGDSMPAFSPSGDSIAFVRASSQRGITDIYTVPSGGGEERRITFDGKTVTGLAWATEERIVFTSNRAGPQMLWSMPAAGGRPELIAVAGRNVSGVSSSSTGRGKLAFVESFRNTNIWRLDLTRPGAPAERLIATTRRNDSPKYSPDGKRIVFGSDRSGAYEIWVSDTNGLGAKQITRFGGTAVGTPRWSPDGRNIVFDAGKDGRSVIYIVDGTGGAPRLFVEERWDSMMPSWSADGNFIYFASRRDGEGLRVWKKPVSGGPAVQLTHITGGEAVEAVGGNLIYFSDGRNGLWQVSPDGTGERPVPGFEHLRHSRYFAVSRRGFYFLRDVDVPWEIDHYDMRSRMTARVALIEKGIGYGLPNLSVSPDEHWLLYTQFDDSGSDILMLDGLR